MSAPKAEAAGLTVERREELRRLAEAATPGPWEVPVSIHGDPFVVQKGKGVLNGGCIARASGEDYGRANATHIAAFDPPTVLALLDALAAAEAERDEARAAVERVRGLADEWEHFARSWRGVLSRTDADLYATRLRAALDTASSEGA